MEEEGREEEEEEEEQEEEEASSLVFLTWSSFTVMTSLDWTGKISWPNRPPSRRAQLPRL